MTQLESLIQCDWLSMSSVNAREVRLNSIDNARNGASNPRRGQKNFPQRGRRRRVQRVESTFDRDEKKKNHRASIATSSVATDDRHCRRADAVGGIHGDDIGNVFIQSKASMIASAHS